MQVDLGIQCNGSVYICVRGSHITENWKLNITVAAASATDWQMKSENRWNRKLMRIEWVCSCWHVEDSFVTIIPRWWNPKPIFTNEWKERTLWHLVYTVCTIWRRRCVRMSVPYSIYILWGTTRWFVQIIIRFSWAMYSIHRERETFL